MKKRINNSNPKESWRVAKSILGIRKNNSPREIIDENQKIESNPTRIANIMNDYFIKKTEILREDTNNQMNDPTERVKRVVGNKLNNKEVFELKPITRTTLRRLMKRSKGSKACGYDMIDGASLKTAAPIIEDTLIHMVNLSILSNEFACQWKHLNLHPRHKKGDPTLKENQRPDSHIQEVGKIVERAVAEQITEYMVKNKLMSKSQHGVMKDLTPVTAIICIQDILMEAAEQKDLASILLIDLTAAFDLVDH